MKIGVKWKYRILLDIYENMFLWKHLRANYLTISQEYIDLVHESVAEVVKLSISRYNKLGLVKAEHGIRYERTFIFISLPVLNNTEITAIEWFKMVCESDP